MKSTEKAIRDFCGHHADWWPSTTQVQEMLALAQPCPTCEALARTVMLDQTSHDTQRQWVGLTDEEVQEIMEKTVATCSELDDITGDTARLTLRNLEAKLKEKNGG
jgi:bacterioferritin-associated ferredoxin